MKNSSLTPQVVVFYPSDPLSRLLQAWAERHRPRELRISFERSLAGIRSQVELADFALVDATEDPALASDAFFQVFNHLGPESVAVYTDVTQNGLELLVRRLGVTMLLGPMSMAEWDDFFQHRFPRTIPLVLAQRSFQTVPPEQDSSDEETREPNFAFKSIAG